MTSPSLMTILEGQEVRYAVRPSRTATRCRIRVSPTSVEVIVPRSEGSKRAAEFLTENAVWVVEQMASVEKLSGFRRATQGPSQQKMLLRGREVCLAWHLSYSRQVAKFCLDREGVLTGHIPQDKEAERLQILERWLRREARQAIETRIAERSVEMGVTFGRLFLLDQKTRWGGCSRRKNLSFNWRLILAPPEVLDYIVVHELAHLIEPYHSPKFWLIVQSFCPHFEQHKAWLKESGWKLSKGLNTHRL